MYTYTQPAWDMFEASNGVKNGEGLPSAISAAKLRLVEVLEVPPAA